MLSPELSNLKLDHQIKHLQQVCIEDQFSKRNLKSKLIDELINNDTEVQAAMKLMEHDIKQQLAGIYYESKLKRYAHLTKSPEEIVQEIVLISVHCREWTAIQEVAGQLGVFLEYDDPFDGVKTAAELLAVTERRRVFFIDKNTNNELIIKSNIIVSKQLESYASQLQYLPPSIVPPRKVIKNHHSGYKNSNGSLILGKGNHHDKPIALDVINILSAIPLSLDAGVLAEEEPYPDSVETAAQMNEYNFFISKTKETCKLIIDNGNVFYFPWKYDKRGRTYSQGYHINLQANEYRKAMINLANKELVV